MLIFWTGEVDKFGLHSSLLAQLKTVALEIHVYLFISSWIRRWWPSTSGVSSSLSCQVKWKCFLIFFARPMHSTSQFDKAVLSKCVCVCNALTISTMLLQHYSILATFFVYVFISYFCGPQTAPFVGRQHSIEFNSGLWPMTLHLSNFPEKRNISAWASSNKEWPASAPKPLWFFFIRAGTCLISLTNGSLRCKVTASFRQPRWTMCMRITVAGVLLTAAWVICKASAFPVNFLANFLGLSLPWSGLMKSAGCCCGSVVVFWWIIQHLKGSWMYVSTGFNRLSCIRSRCNPHKILRLCVREPFQLQISHHTQSVHCCRSRTGGNWKQHVFFCFCFHARNW